MLKVNIYNQQAEKLEEMEVSTKVFAVKTNPALVHQAMVAQMSNERQVLAHTKDRSEVRGGGKKPWRQKGTGRARAGSSRSPIWIGGGITFGPRNERNFSKKINKKMKQKALFMVISDRLADNHLVAIDSIKLEEFKTKLFNEIIKNIETKVLDPEQIKKQRRSFLFITADNDKKVKYSGRNLKGVKMLTLENINIVDLLQYRYLIMSKEVINKLEERLK